MFVEVVTPHLPIPHNAYSLDCVDNQSAPASTNIAKVFWLSVVLISGVSQLLQIWSQSFDYVLYSVYNRNATTPTNMSDSLLIKDLLHYCITSNHAQMLYNWPLHFTFTHWMLYLLQILIQLSTYRIDSDELWDSDCNKSPISLHSAWKLISRLSSPFSRCDFVKYVVGKISLLLLHCSVMLLLLLSTTYTCSIARASRIFFIKLATCSTRSK